MAGLQTRVAGYIRPDGMYEHIQSNQKYCFVTSTGYVEVRPDNLQMNLQYPGIRCAVYWDDQSAWLPDGIRFCTEVVAPAPPVQPPTWSYFYGNQWCTLDPGQKPKYLCNGEYRDVKSQQDVEWAKHPECTPGIEYLNGQVMWLPSGTPFYLNTATTVVISPASGFYDQSYTSETLPGTLPGTLPIPPSQAPANPVLQTPPQAPANPVLQTPPQVLASFVPSTSQEPLPPSTPSKTEPQPQNHDPDPVIQTLRSSQATKKKCNECGKMVPNYSLIFENVVCRECVMDRLCDGRLSSMKGGVEVSWSARMIAELYSQLSKIPDEAIRARLPPIIPLPLNSSVCIARDVPEQIGYPAEGHIIGSGSLVVEGGCPNGHVLCKGCATKLTTCPKCKSFVPYKDVPSKGCPAHPEDETHCATFVKVCQVEGCTGGTWAPKTRPEEAKVEEVKMEEPKVQPPVERVKGDPLAAEEPPKQTAEAKAEEQPPTV